MYSLLFGNHISVFIGHSFSHSILLNSGKHEEKDDDLHQTDEIPPLNIIKSILLHLYEFDDKQHYLWNNTDPQDIEMNCDVFAYQGD